MIISKTFSGLNMNALKYLLPLWISPLTGVTLRCTFAALAFWIISLFTQPETSTRREKILLFLLGALGIYGFMFFYLLGLSKNDPCVKLHFLQFTTYLGIHSFCHLL